MGSPRELNSGQIRARDLVKPASMLGDQPVPPTCPECEEEMVLLRAIPRLGVLPELFGFYCLHCHRAETIEYRLHDASAT
jgi:hypothetical protein